MSPSNPNQVLTTNQNGELTIGGVDTTKYTGALTYFAKSTVSPYSYYWGINVASITYGSTLLSSSANAIVDTGTTLIYIPTSAYNKFLSAAGGTTDPSSGLAEFWTEPTGTVTFTFGSTGYPLTPPSILPTLALASPPAPKKKENLTCSFGNLIVFFAYNPCWK